MADLDFTIGGNLDELRKAIRESRSDLEGLRGFITSELQDAIKSLNTNFTIVGEAVLKNTTRFDNWGSSLSRTTGLIREQTEAIMAYDRANARAFALQAGQNVGGGFHGPREMQGPMPSIYGNGPAGPPRPEGFMRPRDAAQAAQDAMILSRAYNAANREQGLLVTGNNRLVRVMLEASRGAEDAAVSFGYGGWAGALRASLNNISQMGSMINPAVGAVAGFGAALAAIVIPRLLDTGKEAKKAGEELRNLGMSYKEYIEFMIRVNPKNPQWMGLGQQQADAQGRLRTTTDAQADLGRARQQANEAVLRQEADRKEAINLTGANERQAVGGRKAKLWEPIADAIFQSIIQESKSGVLIGSRLQELEDKFFAAREQKLMQQNPDWGMWSAGAKRQARDQFGGMPEGFTKRFQEIEDNLKKSTFTASTEQGRVSAAQQELKALQGRDIIKERAVGVFGEIDRAAQDWWASIKETADKQKGLKTLIGDITNATDETKGHSETYRRQMEEIAKRERTGEISGDQAGILRQGVELAETNRNLKSSRWMRPETPEKSRMGQIEGIDALYNRILQSSAGGKEKDPVKAEIEKHREEQRQQSKVAEKQRQEYIESSKNLQGPLKELAAKMLGPGVLAE